MHWSPDIAKEIPALQHIINDLRRYRRACVQTAGVTGAVFFTEGPVRNYRDACKPSQRVFMAYWYGMLERGIIPQCYGRDDAWTLTLAHSHKDIERVISAFDDLAGLISEVQRGSEIEAARTTN